MRIDVKKFLFWGVDKERSAFFKKAQELGIIHFIGSSSTSTTPIEIQNVASAIKILQTLPVVEQEEIDDEYTLTDEIVNAILALQNQLDKAHEHLRVANLNLARLAPFGDYSAEDLDWIEKEGHRTIQFYCGTEGYATKYPLPDELIQVATDYGLDYFIGINSQPKQYEKLIELKPDAPLSELRKRQHQLRHEIHNTEHELKKYARYNQFLHHALISKLNSYHLTSAEQAATPEMDSMLFVAAGWVPINKVAAVQQLAAHLHVNAEEIAIEEQDAIPTYLENQGFGRMGEDLVHVYDTPSKEDKDPSLYVLFFFALFFSIIVGDAGYGLVLFLVALYFRQKHKKITKAGKRVLNLFFILCGFTIIWGALTTSFFGITFAPDSKVRQFSLISWLAEHKAAYHFANNDAVAHEWITEFPQLAGKQDPTDILMTAATPPKHPGGTPVYEMLGKFTDNIMMELALLIGCLHIIISFIRNLNRNIAGIGWIAFIVGAYLYLPSYLGASSLVNYAFGIDPTQAAQAGQWLMISGIVFALGANVFKHGLMGLLEAMNIIQIFADVMSYLRLYALGLAGSLVTATMIELASGLNVVLAALLLVTGHIVNIVLGIMGGVIHGLRLNFLEWYHHSFEGGGKRFNPLKKVEIE